MNKHSRILVTGATGFIGTHLVQQLTSRGFQVRALCRRTQFAPIPGFSPPHPLTNPNVEVVMGDVTDRPSIDRAMQDCSHVFHVAGLASQWQKDPANYSRVNIDGMRNVLESARKAWIQRTVVTSTIVTLGPTKPGQVGDETMPRSTPEYFTEYERTKAVGEQIALEYAADGEPIVIVNPTRVYGPGYLNEGNSVALMIDEYDRGKFPVLLNRGINIGNYVMVDDVVNGHILAMLKGTPGERYILGGENISLKGFFKLVDEVSGGKHFQFSPRFIPQIVAWVYEKRAQLLGMKPQITPGWLNTFLADWEFTCDKAQQQLGYRPTSMREGIEKTYRWLIGLRKKQTKTSAVPARKSRLNDRQTHSPGSIG